MASAAGKAIALTPDFTARISVFARWVPFGRMQPNAIGVWGIMFLDATRILAMVDGDGGTTVSIAVRCIGMKAIKMTAAGV